MLSLKSRQDKFRLLFPEELIPKDIYEKYASVVQRERSYIYKPIDVINESIQKIQVLGFSNGTIAQPQTMRGTVAKQGDPNFERNNFLHTSSDYIYRSEENPVSLIDKTLNVEFRHINGFLNYFIMFESFFYQYARDTEYDKLPSSFAIEIFNERGEAYCRIVLKDPLIDAMDMLDLDFTQPTAQSQTFRVVFKYSDIDFQFIESDYDTKDAYDEEQGSQ